MNFNHLHKIKKNMDAEYRKPMKKQIMQDGAI